jgi:hypothetical protein
MGSIKLMSWSAAIILELYVILNRETTIIL